MKISWLVKMFCFWLVYIGSYISDYGLFSSPGLAATLVGNNVFGFWFLFSSPGLVVTSAMQLVVSTRVVTAGVAHHHLSHILMRGVILVLY